MVKYGEQGKSLLCHMMSIIESTTMRNLRAYHTWMQNLSIIVMTPQYIYESFIGYS